MWPRLLEIVFILCLGGLVLGGIWYGGKLIKRWIGEIRRWAGW